MSWNDEPNHPFAGIAEKLKRTDENIVNLNTEIERFINGGEYPVIPHKNTQAWQDAVSYHRDKRIPIRFSILAGEIVHHLRSCLDHIVWHFSNRASRAEPNFIEFPIFKAQPRNKKELTRYGRKVEGITNTDVLRLIESMQPYLAGADAADHALLIIHDMDRFDKHRELLIVDSGLMLHIPPSMPELRRKAELYNQGKLPQSEHLEIAHALQDYPVSPNVSFREFGQHRPYPVIKGLIQLFGAVDVAVSNFAPLA